jgi:ribosomal protein S1
MEGGRSCFLEDLDITAFCPVAQMIPAIDPKEPNKIFAPGDKVRCEILKITPAIEKVIVGMKGTAISAELTHSVQLGLILKGDIPLQLSYV